MAIKISNSTIIDDSRNVVNAGIVTAQEYFGDASNLSKTAPLVKSVLYVAKNGNDTNPGTRLSEPKATIKSAVAAATTSGTTAGTVIKVSAGTYLEDNPIKLPPQISIDGDSLREVSVVPQNADKDLFLVSPGNYIGDISFTGTMNSGQAIIAFDPEAPRYSAQSPYIRNCTNFVTNSIGMRVDGNAVIGPFKSMVVDSYTQYNSNGIGVSITNEGYAQLVSIFTINPDISIFTGSGGQCDLTNSNSSFGNFGLISDGIGPIQYVGIITTSTNANNSVFELNLTSPVLSVKSAEYDSTSGLLTTTTYTPHDLNVGMSVTLSNYGFTCPGSSYAHQFKSAVDGSVTIVGVATTTPTAATYDDSNGELVLTIANHGLTAATSHTISGGTYNPSTGILNSTVSDHGFTGFTAHTAESGTLYDPVSGIATITVSNHGFSIGERIKLDDGSLTFTCDKDDHATNHPYPRSSDPYSNKYTSILSTTTNTFNVNVGTSSNIGIHTFVSGTAGGIKKANDHVKILDGSLTFTCAKDDNATQHAYPRISDPISNKWVAIGSTTENTFDLDVGVSRDTSTHSFVSATSNGLLKANSLIGISTNGITFSCSKDNYATDHSYPRPTDPAAGEVLGIEERTANTFKVNVGVSTRDIFPSGVNGSIFTINEVVGLNTFTTYVGPNSRTHNYVSGGNAQQNFIRPFDGQVVYIDDDYKSVKKITVTSGGSGYTRPPTITIGAPSEPWGIPATAVAQLTNGIVTSIDIVSNGRGYTSTPSVSVSAPESGTSASVSLEIGTDFFVVQSATEISSGITTVTFTENIPFAVGVGTTVPFFKQSRILASSHSFEYIGSGVDLIKSIPARGGVAIPENEIADRNGGLTIFTSTDQAGNFKIGDGVVINQQTGTVSGDSYTRSLFSTLTPFILALGGE